jgi:hypothetical protein
MDAMSLGLRAIFQPWLPLQVGPDPGVVVKTPPQVLIAELMSYAP